MLQEPGRLEAELSGWPGEVMMRPGDVFATAPELGPLAPADPCRPSPSPPTRHTHDARIPLLPLLAYSSHRPPLVQKFSC